MRSSPARCKHLLLKRGNVFWVTEGGGRVERDTYLHALTLHLGDAGGGNGVQLEAEVRGAGGDLSDA